MEFAFFGLRFPFAGRVQIRLFDVGEDAVDPAAGLTPAEAMVRISDPGVSPTARRETFLLLQMRQAGRCQIARIVKALSTSPGLARGLNGGQCHRHQNANDGNHDQKFH